MAPPVIVEAYPRPDGNKDNLELNKVMPQD